MDKQILLGKESISLDLWGSQLNQLFQEGMVILIHIYFTEERDSLALLKVSFIQYKKLVQTQNIDNFADKLYTE